MIRRVSGLTRRETMGILSVWAGLHIYIVVMHKIYLGVQHLPKLGYRIQAFLI